MIYPFNTKILSLLFLCAAIGFSSCSKDDDDPVVVVDPVSIVETAKNDTQFTTLVEALTKAELVSTLEGGTFTVFAPTNDAFDQLFTDLGVTGLEELSKEELSPILLYHVVAGEVKSADLTSGYVGTASNGPNSQPIKLSVDITSGVKLDKSSTVTTADVATSNGVIHIIDKVLLPKNVVDLALGNDNFTSLVAALTRDDLTFDFVEFLSGPGPFTVFAPTNDAFQDLLDSDENWNSLADIDVATLEAVLKYHVISGTNFESASLTDGFTGVTAGGGSVTINTGGAVTVTDANGGVATVIIADVQGTNGVVHAIGKVLVP